MERTDRERFYQVDVASSAISEAIDALYAMRQMAYVTPYEREIEIPRLIRILEIERAEVSHLRIRADY